MKNKQLHFFLLEFTLGLIILSVTLLVVFTMFTKAASIHTETEALRQLSETVIMKAETLRNPTTLWPSSNQVIIETTMYDLKGKVTETDAHYILTITYQPNSTLNQAELVLTNQDKVILIQMKVSTLSELTR